MIENGNRFLLVLDGSIIGKSLSVSLSYDRDTIEVTQSRSGGATQRIYGNRSGTLSMSRYYSTADKVIEPGTIVDWLFTSPSGTFYGNGIVPNYGLEAGSDDAPFNSVSIETTGRIFFVPQLEATLCIGGATVTIDNSKVQAKI